MREAPFLSTDKIEDIIESELHKAQMMPTVSKPVLDLDAFISSYLKCGFDPYADLPSDVMGEVCFSPGKRPNISINKDLSIGADTGQSVSVVGRHRATVAHEASHVILHKGLFASDPDQGLLFSMDEIGKEANQPRVHRCFKRHLGKISPQSWEANSGEFLSRNIQNIEIQANKGMSAMLLPRPVFIPFFVRIATTLKTSSSPQLMNAQRESLISEICENFQVSRTFALIRIRTIKLEAILGQELIALFDAE